MIYLDNAATTFPKPACVKAAVISAIDYYGGNPGRGGHKMAMRVSEKIYSVRKKCADFFGADVANVVFTSNCTMSLNMAIKGLVPSKTHVIISCFEHNSVLRPVHTMMQQGTLEYSVISPTSLDEMDIVKAFENEIKENTSAIICTHTSNVSGIILPIEKISALCKKHGLIFIVDAAQSAGILPIDMKQTHIDALCMPGHKGLYGTTGTGLLLLDGRNIKTIVEGGTGTLSSEYTQPDDLPERMEAGTINTVGILSLGAGIDYINTRKQKTIYTHEKKLCNRLYKFLRNNDKIILYQGDFADGMYSPIVCFNVKGKYSDEITSMLSQYHVAARGGLHCAPLTHQFYNTLDCGMVRISPSAFTTEAQIDQLINKIEIIMKNF